MASKRTENILIGIVLVGLIAIWASHSTKPNAPSEHVGVSNTDTGSQHVASEAAMNEPLSVGRIETREVPSDSDYVPPLGHPNMTRAEQIRALQELDPSSYGYTDSDRAFLREHGLSEAEARAIETILGDR